MSHSQESQSLPSLPQVLGTQALLQETWLMLVQHCHRADYQETANSLVTTAEGLLVKEKASTAFVEETKAMLLRLIEACYDTSAEKTLSDMRAAFEQINSRLPVAYEERQGQSA